MGRQRNIKPKTLLSKRLQEIFGSLKLAEISEILGVGREGIRSYLAGDTAPDGPLIAKIVTYARNHTDHKRCTSDWLLGLEPLAPLSDSDFEKKSTKDVMFRLFLAFAHKYVRDMNDSAIKSLEMSSDKTLSELLDDKSSLLDIFNSFFEELGSKWMSESSQIECTVDIDGKPHKARISINSNNY